jgi:hypothetical protein
MERPGIAKRKRGAWRALLILAPNCLIGSATARR